MGMTWTPEQKAVIDLRERNILVSAAAGSGKTAVLVERIVGMLTDAAHPIDIDQLLVVTFTKAAAGEMRERIGRAIDGLLEKNPEIRIAINCITLETVTEAMNAIRDFNLTDVDIVQLSAARSKTVGRYHMMMGENPIYIISCSGRGEEV